MPCWPVSSQGVGVADASVLAEWASGTWMNILDTVERPSMLPHPRCTARGTETGDAGKPRHQ